MQIIKIDDKEYDTETLSEEANAQLTSIPFVDQELAILNAKALNVALGSKLIF
jgi:hypothetical protein